MAFRPWPPLIVAIHGSSHVGGHPFRSPTIPGAPFLTPAPGLSLPFADTAVHSTFLAVNEHHVRRLATRGAASTPGVALRRTRRKKEQTYPELHGAGGKARHVVLAAEVGGRWSNETAQFLGELAAFKASTAPEIFRERVRGAWFRRWRNILSCTGTKAFVLSLDKRPDRCWQLSAIRPRGYKGMQARMV